MDTVASTADRERGTLDGDEDKAWQRRLRQFSGKTTCLPGELDYDAWRFNVEQLVLRPEIGEGDKRQLILQSLVQPVLGLVRRLGNCPSVQQIASVVEVVYGPSIDGHGLLVKFHDCIQTADESAVEYLQRLQRLLRRVVDSGAVLPDSKFLNLHQQFCRGCRDER